MQVRAKREWRAGTRRHYGAMDADAVRSQPGKEIRIHCGGQRADGRAHQHRGGTANNTHLKTHTKWSFILIQFTLLTPFLHLKNAAKTRSERFCIVFLRRGLEAFFFPLLWCKTTTCNVPAMSKASAWRSEAIIEGSSTIQGV